MMNVRAKFQVQSVMHLQGGQAEVKLTAVHGNDNRTWTKWSPSGELRLSITNPSATEQFSPGAYVFLDFSEAPEKESDEKK
jgi:hypothetical protein